MGSSGERGLLATVEAAVSMTAFHMRLLLGIPFFVLTAFATPASFCLLKLVGSGGGAPDGGLWVQVVMAGTWATTTTAAGIIGFQRFQGTLEYMSHSPLPDAAAFFPLLLSVVLLGAVVSVPESLVLCAALGAAPSLLPAQWISCVLVVLSCACLAPALAVPCLHTLNSAAFEPVFLVVVWTLSGAVLPVSQLPTPLAQAAWATPLAHACAVAEGGAVVPWASVALCLILCAVYGFLGYRALLRVLDKSRTTGKVGLM